MEELSSRLLCTALQFLDQLHDKVPDHIHQNLDQYVARLFASERQLSQMGEPFTLNRLLRLIFVAEHLLPSTQAALRQHTLRAA